MICAWRARPPNELGGGAEGFFQGGLSDELAGLR